MTRKQWAALLTLYGIAALLGVLFLGHQLPPCFGTIPTGQVTPQCLSDWQASRSWLDQLFDAPLGWLVVFVALAAVTWAVTKVAGMSRALLSLGLLVSLSVGLGLAIRAAGLPDPRGLSHCSGLASALQHKPMPDSCFGPQAAYPEAHRYGGPPEPFEPPYAPGPLPGALDARPVPLSDPSRGDLARATMTLRAR